MTGFVVQGHTDTQTHTRMHARTHTHAHARTHARTHTHTHTHTLRFTFIYSDLKVYIPDLYRIISFLAPHILCVCLYMCDTLCENPAKVIFLDLLFSA